MIIDWYKDLDSEGDKERRRQFILAHKKAYDLAKDVVQRHIKETQQAMEAAALFDNPNWAYKQAEYIGKLRALRETAKLLTIEEEAQ